MKPWLLILLVACKQDASPTPGAAPTSAPKSSGPLICPPQSLQNVGFWGAELFWGCQDYPLEQGMLLCGGKRCEQPCTTTSNGEVVRHTFENGRWKGTVGSHSADVTCNYSGNVRTDCDWHEHHYAAERDAKGRVVAIVGMDHRSEVVYSDSGQIVKLDGAAMIYDDKGRLLKWGDTTFGWDGMRVTSDTSPKRKASYAYDDKGRIASIAYDESSPYTLAIDYAGDRVAGWHTHDMKIVFGYDCPE